MHHTHVPPIVQSLTQPPPSILPSPLLAKSIGNKKRYDMTRYLLLRFALFSTCVMTLAAAFSSLAWRSHHVRHVQQQQRHIHAAAAAAAASSDNDATSPPSAESIRQEKLELLHSSTKLSLAPMMEYTDRHFRHVVRLLSSRTLLYTEMVAANAIVHERKDAIEQLRERNQVAAEAGRPLHCDYDASYLRRFLGQGMVAPLEGPSVLQLGGSEPDVLAGATRAVMELTERGYCDYTALNLNCGCPSPKVAGKGCFGAALMDDPNLVRDVTTAMHEGCGGTVPVTVKCRIGTDTDMAADGLGFTVKRYSEMDAETEYSKLRHFVETVASNGIVTDFQVHARIAVLGKSFSPADNRKVPPLKYDFVRRLVQDYPELTFSLNGGVDTLAGAKEELDACPEMAGVMIGRAWAANPWSFACADSVLYSDQGEGEALLDYTKPKNRLEVLQIYGKHADEEEERGDPVKIRRFMTKAVSSLFAGEPNAKRYRIALDDVGGRPKKLASQGKSWRDEPPLSELILDAAAKHLSEEVLLRSPEESYEMILWEEQRQKAREAAMVKAGGGDSKGKEETTRRSIVAEWQTDRKQQQSEAAA